MGGVQVGRWGGGGRAKGGGGKGGGVSVQSVGEMGTDFSKFSPTTS